MLDVVILVELADVSDRLLAGAERPASAIELQRTRMRRAALGLDDPRMARRTVLRAGETDGE